MSYSDILKIFKDDLLLVYIKTCQYSPQINVNRYKDSYMINPCNCYTQLTKVAHENRLI